MKDTKQVVHIHIMAFHGFFLTFLGPSFLNHLYSGLLLDYSGIAFVYEKDGDILGFVAGTSEPKGFYRRLFRSRWFYFGLASIKTIVSQPRVIFRLLRGIKRTQEDVPPGTGTLMSIAVSPHNQGEGIGKKLVEAFLAEANNRSLSCVNLTTDKLNNDSVNQFYQSLGFTISNTFTTPEGRVMNEYTISLH